MKRPRSSIQAILVPKKGDENNQWIPRRLEVGSWVTLYAPKRGPWAQDGRKADICAMDGDFKAQIKDFRLKPNNIVVDQVLVSHAYSFRQLQLPDSRHLSNKI